MSGWSAAGAALQAGPGIWDMTQDLIKNLKSPSADEIRRTWTNGYVENAVNYEYPNQNGMLHGGGSVWNCVVCHTDHEVHFDGEEGRQWLHEVSIGNILPVWTVAMAKMRLTISLRLHSSRKCRPTGEEQ